MRRWLLILPLLLLGADGDSVVPSTGSRDTAKRDILSRYLCFQKTAAGDCSELSGNQTTEAVEVYHFFVATDCTAYNVDLVTKFDVSADTTRTFCSLTNTTTDECYIHKWIDGPLQDVLQGVVNSVTCAGTDSLSVIVEFYEEQK
jgi:hypothetical protein